MTMQIVVFRATLIDDTVMGRHEAIAGEMRALATGVDGCLGWRDSMDGPTFWGYVLFRSDEAVLAWKNHPRHAELRQLGERGVYCKFATHVFADVRHASWRADPAEG